MAAMTFTGSWEQIVECAACDMQHELIRAEAYCGGRRACVIPPFLVAVREIGGAMSSSELVPPFQEG